MNLSKEEDGILVKNRGSGLPSLQIHSFQVQLFVDFKKALQQRALKVKCHWGMPNGLQNSTHTVLASRMLAASQNGTLL